MSAPTTEEKKLYHVMGKLKASNTHRAILHDQINASIDLIEAMIIADPSAALKTLLLKTLQTYNRSKVVAKYKLGKIDFNCEFLIQATDDWMVSVVRGGTKVRVSMSPKRAASCLADLERRGATAIVLYE